MIQTNNNGNCYEENEGINLRFYEDVLDSAQMIHYLQKFKMVSGNWGNNMKKLIVC